MYLASKSPRRKELLQLMGLEFEILYIDIPEEIKQNESFREYSVRICNEKANFAWNYLVNNKLPLYPVLTADTEVIFEDTVLGKPLDYDDAFRMWKMYSGKSNLVITSISLKYEDFQKTLINESMVYFDEVSDRDIHKYLKMGDYKDKSGGYGIQSYAGQFIKRIEGCFFSVMGMPLNGVKQLLQELYRQKSVQK
ncbi:MAG: Maf family protein [Neisseriaceae bacterium]